MPSYEYVILFLRGKQRGHGICVRRVIDAFFDPLLDVGKFEDIVSVSREGCSKGCETVAVFRKDGMVLVQMKGLGESCSQSFKIIQRSAEEHDRLAQTSSLREAGDRLVDDRLIDGCRHILFSSALIEDRLDVSFCKNTAARSDRIDLFEML